MLNELVARLQAEIDPDHAEQVAKYFGVFPGGYGDGDIILGIPVPTVRKICQDYKQLPVKDALTLLESDCHDFRFAALVILSAKATKQPHQIYQLILNDIKHVNNWDLVDVFMPKIIGQHCLENHDESILHHFNRTDDLWLQRISVVSYLAFYRKGVMGDGLEMVNNLIETPQPLIQKANGWMLREIYSKVDKRVVESYLIDNYRRIPRTSLRYAIEHMPAAEHERYLKGEF